MTARRLLACLAAAAVAAAPAVAVAKPSERATAKPSAAKEKRAAAKRKHARQRTARVRWRAASSALRVSGPGVLFAPAPGGGPTVPAPGPGGPAPTDPTTPAPAPPTPIHTLSVASREYSLTLSRQVLTPGLETIQLNNRGEDPHDLVISLDDGVNAPIATYPETPSLESHTEKVELPAGRYKLFCSLPGHEQLGMRATLRVE